MSLNSDEFLELIDNISPTQLLLSLPHPELNPNVQAYLDEHLLRSINLKNTLTMKSGSLRPRNLRRRMSVKGAIKKTRSINVDCKY